MDKFNHFSPTLAIFDEVEQLIQSRNSTNPDDQNQNQSNARGLEIEQYVNEKALPTFLDDNELAGQYLRESCMKIPLKDVTIHCHLEKTNSKSNPTWTLSCEFGILNKFQTLVLSAQKLKTWSGISYKISQDFPDGSGSGNSCLGTLEGSQNIFTVFDNGLTDQQILDSLPDETDRSVVGRKKLASLFIVREASNKFWKRFSAHRMHCTCLVPRLPRHLNLRQPDPERSRALDTAMFSGYTWGSMGTSCVYEKLIGEIKKICYQGLPQYVSQLLLNRPDKIMTETDTFSLTKLPTTSSDKKCYRLKLAAPLSICHAFAIAVSVIESGFD